MRAAGIAEMRRLRIFQDVDDRRVEAMLKSLFLQRFPAGVEVEREGEIADFRHVLVEGKVEVFSACRDREPTACVPGPGPCFIMAAVVHAFEPNAFVNFLRPDQPALGSLTGLRAR